MADTAHPLDGWIKAVTLGSDHAGLNATLLPDPDDSGRLLLIWRSALEHTASTGSVLRMAVSHDRGASFTEERTIYQDPDWDARNFSGGVMADGRLGLLCTRFRAASTGGTEMHTPVFVYSDDGGRHWRSRVLELPSSDSHVNFHGDILAWPGAAGGRDKGGFAAFSYSTPHKHIDGLYSRDNGETWIWRRAVCQPDPKLAPFLTEQWTARLGERQMWMMVARATTSGAAADAAVFLSRDLQNWEGPLASGLNLAGNAPALIVENDTAHLYTVSRRGRDRELATAPDDLPRGNRFMHTSAPVDALLRARGRWGDFGGWREVTMLPEAATGYIFPRRIEERWYAVVNCAETGLLGMPEPKRTVLALITPHAPVIVDAAAWRAAMPQDNLLDNGDFALWNRGGSFDTTAPTATTADRWRIVNPGRDRVEVGPKADTDAAGVPKVWFEKRCADVSGKDLHRTVQRLHDVTLGAGERVCVTLRAATLAGRGLAAVRLRQDFGKGGSEPVEVTLSEGSVALEPVAQMHSFTGALPTLAGKVIGSDAALELVLEELSSPDADGQDDDHNPYHVLYGDVTLTLWPTVTPIRVPHAAEVDARNARYFQRLHMRVRADGAGRAQVVASLSVPMARQPVLRVLGPENTENGYVPSQASDKGALVQVDDLDERHAALTLTGAAPGEVLRFLLLFDSEWNLSPGLVTQPGHKGGDVLRSGKDAGVPLWMPREVAEDLALRIVETPVIETDPAADLAAREALDAALWDGFVNTGKLPADLLEKRRKG
ncbi:sialidase family protein [Ponticoccus alexandrii]|uniref:Exo-alpha-sialidase n=1 Tax=Ponticoccus alexandrii TaxID=1943633 RepID=A0ABX7FEG3_9RHOB|nr:sialidase family protein [Ponticoccus alexandrii]ETA50655.1 hypothetical protein P279_18405 [Rhodobacteraceae bacterium PD-2]QRF68627.1 hypothetical protein GQA70_19770 [Ponticoccus alexandrii]